MNKLYQKKVKKAKIAAGPAGLKGAATGMKMGPRGVSPIGMKAGKPSGASSPKGMKVGKPRSAMEILMKGESGPGFKAQKAAVGRGAAKVGKAVKAGMMSAIPGAAALSRVNNSARDYFSRKNTK